jgi:hypothetical protein
LEGAVQGARLQSFVGWAPVKPQFLCRRNNGQRLTDGFPAPRADQKDRGHDQDNPQRDARSPLPRSCPDGGSLSARELGTLGIAPMDIDRLAFAVTQQAE